MNKENNVDPELVKSFAVLQAVSARNPLNARKGRAAFLQQAEEMAKTVTPPEKRRHNGWMHALQSIFFIRRKEQSPMFRALATMMLIISLVLVGGGATAAAAQNSQPDQLLYSIKLLSEDIRLGLTAGTQPQYQLALEFANRRMDEIRTMIQNGSVPPAAVQTRYQNQVEQAIQFAADLPNDQALQALKQVRTRLQTQQQTLEQVQAHGSPLVEAVLQQSRQMLQERLLWVEEGLTDLARLRDQFHQRGQQSKQDQQNSTMPAGHATQNAPGTGSGNPWTTGTPIPNSGYGPGNGAGDCTTCTPAGNGQGDNPWTTGTPTPGSGYGPGLQPTQPQNNQPTQAGPQPTHHQNQPTQAGPQPTTVPGGPGGHH
jgi:hypothetical protein